MNKNDIIEYVMHTPHNTNKAVLSSMLNQLTEGGGGSGDFSTAQVTFINNTETNVDAACMVIYEEDGEEYAEFEFGCGPSLTGIGEIVLFKGSAYLVWSDSAATYTGTGAVEIEGNETVITGNCTITAS